MRGPHAAFDILLLPGPRVETLNPKIDPAILTAQSSTRSDDVPVIVMFGDRDQLQAFHRQGTRSRSGLSAGHLGAVLPWSATRIRRTDVHALADNDTVRSIWYDALCTTCLDRAGLDLGVPRIWEDWGLYGSGTVVGIADTGLDQTHPDFEGRVAGARDFTPRPAEGDPDGHGTHVSSLAAGSGAASNHRYVGMAPRAHILSARVLNFGGAGRMSRVMAGLEWLVDSGAQVLNLSVGTDINMVGEDPLSALCNTLSDQGTVIVAAAGNSGPRPQSIGSPGSAARVITVGATDGMGMVASFSSRGPTRQGLLKPDLLAPGYNIVGARAADSQLGDVVDQNHTIMSGTSMAAPLVSGLVLLMKEQQPELTPAEIKALLQLNCRSFNLPTTIQGAGQLDGWAAVHSLMPEPLPGSEPEPARPDREAGSPAEVPERSEPQGCLGVRVAKLFQWFRPVA